MYKSNIKDHYGDSATDQCLGMIAEINAFSVSDEMMRNGADWTSADRLFQSRGPAAAKERSPTVTRPGGLPMSR